MAGISDWEVDMEGVRKQMVERGGDKDPRSWTPSEGKTLIRTIPWRKGFCRGFGEHEFNGKRVMCRNHTMGESCPVCELGDRLYNAQSEADKAFGRRLYRRLKFVSNIIVRGKEEHGPFIWVYGVKVYREIGERALYLAENEGIKMPDILRGCDVLLNRTGKKKDDTEYRVYMQKSKPLGTKEQMQRWLKIKDQAGKEPPYTVHDLEAYVKCPSYEEVKAILKGWLKSPVATLEEDASIEGVEIEENEVVEEEDDVQLEDLDLGGEGEVEEDLDLDLGDNGDNEDPSGDSEDLDFDLDGDEDVENKKERKPSSKRSERSVVAPSLPFGPDKAALVIQAEVKRAVPACYGTAEHDPQDKRVCQPCAWFKACGALVVKRGFDRSAVVGGGKKSAKTADSRGLEKTLKQRALDAKRKAARS